MGSTDQALEVVVTEIDDQSLNFVGVVGNLWTAKTRLLKEESNIYCIKLRISSRV
jgi:hypothetical protein